MGASLGSRKKKITEINVTPLVDIVLVLLIVMMVAANFIGTGSIPIELPRADTGEDAPVSTLGVAIDAEENVFLNGEAITLEALEQAARVEWEKNSALQAVIDADKAASHGAVISVIDRVRQAGVETFAINIERSSESN